MRLSSSLPPLVALAGLSLADPNGWSKTKETSDSPTKLDDCGCWPIYQAMLRCQKLKGLNADTRGCVCIPNPDGWYPSMDGCRTCLTSGSDEEFFENMSRLVTQLFVSCTNAGGGVTSDGASICASNYYREACVSLGTGGRPSWASFEVFESKEKGNSSYVLDIDEDGADKDTSTSTGSTTAKTIPVETATGATEPLSTAASTTASTSERSPASSSGSNDASGTETDSASATTTQSSTIMVADARAGGIIRGMMIAVVVGALLF
ncbi:hypothetical protein N0V84_011384 [Fusarium piperis]|uniref:Cell wall protein n=1 Tax=Fusarium piperis TaxID=1435070 RepID=A0A9W8TC85_9HYPO|nr:hypothetical protein N0V84_011384 [Fusarium piperis]